MTKFKQSLYETFQLLWQFKWYILVYLLFCMLAVWEYLNPPAENDPIFNSEAVRGSWRYTSQKVYVGAARSDLAFFIILFLLGTSNMRNHPLIAKTIFLFPLIAAILSPILLIIDGQI